ncbi:hypothetical protein AB4Y90_05890 [Chryseobacterium sp. 2TAF14]|uniref:hypothetical protein n=1 Tax=Chryseobacterium sp. 2TAF14 TaxID=3233007 RepID=UPI003F93CC8F
MVRFIIDLSMDWNFEFDFSNIIDIVSMAVNAFLAVFIVKNIQKSQDNERVIKDHFINEVKAIKDQYAIFYNNVIYGRITAQGMLEWFKLMNIKVSDVSNMLEANYKIKNDIFNPFIINLPDLITNDNCYISQFRSSTFTIDVPLKRKIFDFHSRNLKIFNECIIMINNK